MLPRPSCSLRVDLPSILFLPLTVSLAVVRTPSAEKAMVPVSSRLRLDSVRPCTRPLVLTLTWPVGLTRRPSLCHTPSTSVCDSSTSKEAVSRSSVSWSLRFLRMEILRAGKEEEAKLRVSPSHLILCVMCLCALFAVKEPCSPDSIFSKLVLPVIGLFTDANWTGTKEKIIAFLKN